MFDATDQKLSFAAPLYPLDKIYYKPEQTSVAVSQSADPTAPTFTSVALDNPKGETFFIALQASPDNSTWYDTGLEPTYYDAGRLSHFKRFIALWYMTASVITLKFAALDAGYTLYYRMVGYSKD